MNARGDNNQERANFYRFQIESLMDEWIMSSNDFDTNGEFEFYHRDNFGYNSLGLADFYDQFLQHPEANQSITGEESSADYSRLTTFLEVDNSFLTPWNWKPICIHSSDHAEKLQSDNGSSSDGEELQSNNENSSTNGEKRYMHFEPGSFFTYDVYDVLGKQPLNQEEEKIGLEDEEHSLSEDDIASQDESQNLSENEIALEDEGQNLSRDGIASLVTWMSKIKLFDF